MLSSAYSSHKHIRCLLLDLATRTDLALDAVSLNRLVVRAAVPFGAQRGAILLGDLLRTGLTLAAVARHRVSKGYRCQKSIGIPVITVVGILCVLSLPVVLGWGMDLGLALALAVALGVRARFAYQSWR
jgi:hypothetical protein